VIFAAGFVLYTLIYGLDEAKRVARPDVVEIVFALGLLLYAGTGVVGMIKGGRFLDYGVLGADPVRGQHLGILLIELGVGITVASVIIGVFFAFVGRKRP
jgi:multicomponent Na+:H+ antiporter subunit B